MLWKAKWSFQKVLQVSVEFLSGWMLWHDRKVALVKFGKFSGIFGEFL
jgi:hypothetical protein